MLPPRFVPRQRLAPAPPHLARPVLSEVRARPWRAAGPRPDSRKGLPARRLRLRNPPLFPSPPPAQPRPPPGGKTPGLFQVARNRRLYRLRLTAAGLPTPACPPTTPHAVPCLPHCSGGSQVSTDESATQDRRCFSSVPPQPWPAPLSSD